MKISKALKDNDVKAFKKILFNKLHNIEGHPDSWTELNNSVFKITNIRKYKSEHWRTGENYTYEFDVIVDMKSNGYSYTTRWNKRHPRTANRYYKKYVENTIREIVKHFGVMEDDITEVKKIVWDYL
jgi:hypothetical protein